MRGHNVLIAAALLLLVTSAASAQTPITPNQAAGPAASSRPQSANDDAELNPAEPDFVVVNLPTTMLLPAFKGSFRLTHRFAGNLRRGSFGQQAGNLFGLDQGAIIGLEYRFGVAPHVQAVFHRSSFDKTIAFSGKYDAIRQRRAMPVSISLLASIEGTNNFREHHEPSVGVVISRTVRTWFAAYLTPMFVRNDPSFVGVGARVRVHGTTYIAAEIAPRLGREAAGPPVYGFSIEKRAGGHTFSLTFANSASTTVGQIARGGASQTLFLGFNLGRKFY